VLDTSAGEPFAPAAAGARLELEVARVARIGVGGTPPALGVNERSQTCAGDFVSSSFCSIENPPAPLSPACAGANAAAAMANPIVCLRNI